MSFCDECSIEEKLMQCCGKFPMSRERATLAMTGGVTVTACPHLSPGGRCTIYENRPQGCREFFCDAFQTGQRSFTTGAAD